MTETNLRQSTRLILVTLEVIILFVVSYLALGSWLPPVGVKGFWFYSALLSLLLGSRIVSPFYTKPADAISNAIPALIALLLVNNWSAWAADERLIFFIAAAYCFLVCLGAFAAILTKDITKESIKKISNSFRILVDYLGAPQSVYSLLMLFAIYVYHRLVPKEVIWIGVAWISVVALSPLDVLARLLKKLSIIWRGRNLPNIIGSVVAYQTPNIIMIRQATNKSIEANKPVLVKDPHAPVKMGLTLDYVGRDEGMLLRTIELDGTLKDDSTLLLQEIPDNSVVHLDNAGIDVLSRSSQELLNRRDALVGIVASETNIERMYFEIVKEEHIEEGWLVETYIADKPVLYQIVNGLTKEEIVHQKNTHGYVRAQAQKIGSWDKSEGKFKGIKWLPKLNAPVFLVKPDDFVQTIAAVGHFPRTNYSVGIRNLHDIVTHNTAILGILGVGKSMLAIELVERMISEGIKVICLDLTNQYSQELSEYYDSPYEEERIKLMQDAGCKDQDRCADNPEKGGSLTAFSQAIYDDLREFLDSSNKRMLKIYNPSQLFATKQLSEPKQYKEGAEWKRGAALWSITPVEVASIISEASLELLQDAMVDKARACLVYEEAHSLVPEWNSVASDGDRAATNRTARAILQGRKYGLGCLLITQRTANVTKTILNQCNTIFAMRTFDETGKEFLSNYIGKDYAGVLSSFPSDMQLFSARHLVARIQYL